MHRSVLGSIAAFALVATIPLISAVPLSTPAAAAKQTLVPQRKMLAICKRTPGCEYSPELKTGCSSHACFKCRADGKGCFKVAIQKPKGGVAGTKPASGVVQQPQKSPLKTGVVGTKPGGGVLQQPTNTVGPKREGAGRPAQNRK